MSKEIRGSLCLHSCQQVLGDDLKLASAYQRSLILRA